MVSEKKWKSTYSEMKEILKNGFQELSNEKIGFDWNSVKTSSAKFISDAIRISDKNGVQKSVPVKIISSDELSGICGKECRTDLSRICGTGYCLVKSVSSKKIRWEY